MTDGYGFSGILVPCSADPEKDGYHVTWQGFPFHVIPETQPQWDLLQEAIADGSIKPEPFCPAIPSMDEAKASKIAALYHEYINAPNLPAIYTTADGVKGDFVRSQDALNALDAFISLGEKSWSIDGWIDVDLKIISPFSYADLQGLKDTIADMKNPTFEQLMKAVSKVKSAKKLSIIDAVSL